MARLGLYTTWLIPAALVGVLVFLFGFIYLSNNLPAQDVCTIGKNIRMCPLCDVVSELAKIVQRIQHARHSSARTGISRILARLHDWVSSSIIRARFSTRYSCPSGVRKRFLIADDDEFFALQR